MIMPVNSRKAVIIIDEAEQEMEDEEFKYVEARPVRTERGRAALRRKRNRARRIRMKVGLILAAFILGMATGGIIMMFKNDKGVSDNNAAKGRDTGKQIGAAVNSVFNDDASETNGAGTKKNGTGITTDSHTVTYSKSQKILLDPGHGFADPGTSSDFLGCAEKDMTVLMAGLLKEELEKRGYFVMLTHDGQSFPEESEVMRKADSLGIKYSASNFAANDVFSAYERTIYANVLNAGERFDLFLSLHVNAVESGNASGFQLDYCSENSYSEKSGTISDALKESLVSAFPETQMKYRADKYDDAFIVTKYSQMPSMLLEMGYATNEIDASNLNDTEWRGKFIKAVADGIEAGLA